MLVLILSVYFAANGPELVAWLHQAVPSDRQRHVRFLVTVVNRVVGGYVRGTATLATIIAVLVGVGLWLLGVPYAAMLGVLAFFMEFIPVLGVFITGAAAVLLALFQGWQLRGSVRESAAPGVEHDEPGERGQSVEESNHGGFLPPELDVRVEPRNHDQVDR